MKILITGGTGMVGKAINDLINGTYECRFLSSKDIDLRKYESTYYYFRDYQPTHVIHLAANVGGLYKNMANNIELFHDNMLINMNVLKVCNKLEIQRVVCCLSTCIFPDKVDKYPITEKVLHLGPPHESNEGYAYAKRMLDVLCNMYNKSFNRHYVCVTPCNIYGEYDNFSLEDGHVIPALVHRAYLVKTGKLDNFVVKGTGEALRQFINSKDVANLCLWALLEYKDTESLILASKNVYQIKDIVYMICKYMDISYKKVIYDTNYSDGQHLKNVSNLKLLTAFNQTMNEEYKFIKMEDGLQSMISWFIENYNDCRK